MLDRFFDGKLAPFIETNRGCPFKCTFCHTGNDYFNKINMFSAERINAEIDYIGKKQIQIWDEKQNASLLIADTEFLVLKIWSEEKFKSCSYFIDNNFNKQKFDLYFLCKPDIPWIYDPLRESENQREELFKKYPNPGDLANAVVSELSKMLTPLGMQNKRAMTLIRFSKEYLDGFSDPSELYGIGKYAKDSWEIFQHNNLNVQPNDKVLNLYLATALEQQTQMGRS